MKHQILCVGPDAKNCLRSPSPLAEAHPEWELTQAPNGREGLAKLETASFDAVVADLDLPDMDGVKFLNAVRDLQPGARRLMVAELSEPWTALRCSGAAHHCLPKPWNGAMLQHALERLFSLNLWLSNPAVRALAGKMSILPSAPELYFEVVRLLQSPDVGLEEIGGRVARDPAITAKLLQLSNSAVLGLKRRVTTAQEAISYLGLETTRSLILLAHTFSYCEHARPSGFSIESLWRHSLAVGSCARRIARMEESPAELADECFLAGLLHDIGKLLLAVNLPAEYNQVLARAQRESLPAWECELDQFGATHGEVGAELLAMWNLPLTVVEALALHHYPSKLISFQFSPLAAVHAADVFEHEAGADSHPGKPPALELDYLADLGLAGRVDAWRETCGRELEAGRANLNEAT